MGKARVGWLNSYLWIHPQSIALRANLTQDFDQRLRTTDSSTKASTQ